MPGMTIRVGGRDGGEGKTKGCYWFVTIANGYVYRDVMWLLPNPLTARLASQHSPSSRGQSHLR